MLGLRVNATPVPEMTVFDRAYLGALYAERATTSGLSTVMRVNRELNRQVQAEANADE